MVDRQENRMRVIGRFCYNTADPQPWEEEFTLPDGTFPTGQTITLLDVGGICWPDVVEKAVCTQTGAINCNCLEVIRT